MSHPHIIKEIKIKHVKGFLQETSFKVDLMSGRPNLIVAPNGTGKSSIAIAFASLKKSRIQVDDKDLPLGISGPEPKLEFICQENRKDEIYLADSSQNTISNNFQIFVINSKLQAKARQVRGNGFINSTAEITIPDPVLVDSIPDPVEFDYKISQSKKSFGLNGKILPNIGDLLNNFSFIQDINESWDDLKVWYTTKIQTSVADLKNYANSLSGTREKILSDFNQDKSDVISSIPGWNIFKGIIEKQGLEIHTDEFFFAFIQIMELINKDKKMLNQVYKNLEYKTLKSELSELLGDLNTTNQKISPSEKDGKLIVKMPKAYQVSNGQRDLLSFICQLRLAKIKLRNKKCILIIDEIFDYLDDANLVAAQYYISQFIEEMSTQIFFPIIFTHLDPGHFKTFVFQKQRVSYLTKTREEDEKKFVELIRQREDPSIKAVVSSHYLHYHPDRHTDLTREFTSLNLKETWGSQAQRFIDDCNVQMNKYLQGKAYSAIGVCVMLRQKIESELYNQLTESDKRDHFLNKCKGTLEKIEYIRSMGKDVPEVYSLLGIIHNEALHTGQNSYKITIIRQRLNHLVIRKLISTIMN